jgi:hypothetical protein
LSEWMRVGPVKPDEQCVYCQAYVGPLGYAYQDGGMICRACYQVQVTRKKEGGSAELSDTTLYGNSRHAYAHEHGLRPARYPEGSEFHCVLCCPVCGETHRLQPLAVIPGGCAVCGTAWAAAAPTFWVLVPHEKEGP